MKNLKLRAEIIAKIRDFFVARKVLEVETPLLCRATNPAPHLQNFYVNNLYLQTSPEFAMKRLLTTGSGDIYQICKAFRDGEVGRSHNPEFTILEWYRINFDHYMLMNEIDELLKLILKTSTAERLTYQELFVEFLQLDPHTSNIDTLKKCADQNNIQTSDLGDDKDAWLQLLLTHLIEPKIAKDRPLFIYDYPKSQAMLARINAQNLAERFEVYFHGMELANGFHELNDAEEQRARFIQDLDERKKLNLPSIPIDEEFLAALPNLPNCSGVAIGIDRLIMLALNANSIHDVLSIV